MGNTRLTVGELGKISFSETQGRIRARARLCLPDRDKPDPVTGVFPPGPLVFIEATAPTREQAVESLALARERRLTKVATVHAASSSTTVAEFARSSIEESVADGSLRPTSGYLYRRHVERHLSQSSLGKMVPAKASITDIEAFVSSLTAVGAPTARLGRAVIKRSFRAAETAKVITPEANPGRMAVEVKVRKSRRTGRLDRGRALKTAERVTLAWAVSRDQRAVELDVRDLILAGLALGTRVGETLALRWQDIVFNQDGTATVSIRGTITRTPDGLRRTPPKTAESERDLHVSRRNAALLRRRAGMFDVCFSRQGKVSMDGHDSGDCSSCNGCRLVFPTPGRWGIPGEGTRPREVGNTTKILAGVFERAGFGWLSYHGLRRSAATRLIATHGVVAAAEYLGHTDTGTTLRSYAGRSGVTNTGL